jgi:hypothetical protein
MSLSSLVRRHPVVLGVKRRASKGDGRSASAGIL